MVASLSTIIKRLQAVVQPPAPPPPPPPVVPDVACPLTHPDAPLPAWVADDPVVQQYQALLGSLPWDQFPERPTDRPWPGTVPDPRAPFVAAYLIKLHDGLRWMSDLRRVLLLHPALVYWLGFARIPDPTAAHGFDVAATVPSRKQLSAVLRTLSNGACQFLLTATVQQLQQTLPPDQQETFGDTIALDTQALLAWVKENNPKQYIKEGRLDKTRQPSADPDCKLGVKGRRNHAPAHADGGDDVDSPAPTTEGKPASQLQVGVDIFWGYASGVVASRLPDGTEIVLAERTRPFNEDDSTHFFPLMQQVEARLGRRPRFGALDAAYDAQYVHQYFYDVGGMAAVPKNPGKGGSRQFAPDGRPLCAAGLAMTLEFTYESRTDKVPHQKEQFRCPLRFPTATGDPCPCADPHFGKGGCKTTIAAGMGSRLRHTLDRESDAYKQLYAKRTMVERINSQAEALGILHPKLRRGRAIVNQNSLTYVLINLRALARIRAQREDARPARTA